MKKLKNTDMQRPTIRRRLTILVSVTAALVLAGCAGTAGIAPKATATAPQSAGLHSGMPMPQIAADWWRAFGDDGLSGIVDRALAGNPTLGIAEPRAEADSA